MGLKINSIIVLENNDRYLILKEAMYYGKKYFLAMSVDENNQVDSKKIIVLEEYVSGFETYVSKVIDKEVMTVLTRMFKAQVEIT